MEPITHDFFTEATPGALYRAVATQDGQRAWWCKDCEVSEERGGQHEREEELWG